MCLTPIEDCQAHIYQSPFHTRNGNQVTDFEQPHCGGGRGAGPMGLWADSWDNSELMLQSRATCFCPDSDTGVKSTGFTGFTVVAGIQVPGS